MQSKQKKMLLAGGALAALVVLLIALMAGGSGSMFKGSLAELTDDGSENVAVDGGENVLNDDQEGGVAVNDESAVYNVSCVLSASKDPWSLAYADPDRGVGYAKWNRPNSLNIDWAAPNPLDEVNRGCAQSVYDNLSAAFCPANPGVEYDLSYNIYLAEDGSLVRNERSSIVTGWGSGVRRCPPAAPAAPAAPNVPITNLDNMKSANPYVHNNAQVIKIKR